MLRTVFSVVARRELRRITGIADGARCPSGTAAARILAHPWSVRMGLANPHAAVAAPADHPSLWHGLMICAGEPPNAEIARYTNRGSDRPLSKIELAVRGFWHLRHQYAYDPSRHFFTFRPNSIRHCHAGRSLEETRPSERSMIARRLRHAGLGRMAMSDNCILGFAWRQATQAAS